MTMIISCAMRQRRELHTNTSSVLDSWHHRARVAIATKKTHGIFVELFMHWGKKTLSGLRLPRSVSDSLIPVSSKTLQFTKQEGGRKEKCILPSPRVPRYAHDYEKACILCHVYTLARQCCKGSLMPIRAINCHRIYIKKVVVEEKEEEKKRYEGVLGVWGI